MSPFDPAAYGPVFGALLREARLMPLDPGTPNAAAKTALDAIDLDRAFAPNGVGDPHMAEACRSALYLYHDYTDISHAISQKIETSTGSYWHGVMHRREPDYTNSKYWFRRVGEHAVFPTLHAEAMRIARDTVLPDNARFLLEGAVWDPFAFVDLCEAAHTGRVSATDLCRRIQQREWELLFDYSYRQAKA